VSTSKGFPWGQAMNFGFGILRLSSRDFWAMTPRELKSAMDAFRTNETTPVSRDWLNATSKLHPDTKKQTGGSNNGNP